MGSSSGHALRRGVALACAIVACVLYASTRRSPFYGATLRSPRRRRLSLILSADPGDMIGGFSEAAVLLDVAHDLETIDVAKEDLFCPTAHRGDVAGQPVLIVTTGIGATRAALCLDSLLRVYGPEAREVLFLGTAGGSPAVGGILDSDACGAANQGAAAKLVRLGDVCVSPFATDWDCQRCFWAAEPYAKPAPGALAEAPETARSRNACSLHDRWDLFGDFGCSYFTEPSLADEVLAATRNLEHTPRAPPELRAFEAGYWAATGAARGAESWAAAYARAEKRDARAWGYDVCGEATSATYWNGAPYDELARGYVAELMRETAAAYPNGTSRAASSKRDVLAISAMEGAGWMAVLKLSETYLDFAHLPSANVRGVADYTHDPVVRYADDVWLEDATWVSPEGRANATRAGYAFAITTTSTAVLALLQSRGDGLHGDVGIGGRS
ncbi:hypothetical protein SO694_000611113 [Aureococcus anophagefferens]|uniref:Nucleoside phosphorylase domain-containing protein n=1 Tax=Aureococcus anophagefferens TaxID=44056 RepID=A0ABR1FRH9_AURAN|nr:hypothetical protein JL720_10899 [Aureococcus anophagefferens]